MKHRFDIVEVSSGFISVRDVTARWIREKELHRRMAFLEAGQTTL